MSYENRFWDRDSLYEEVWATPMAKLAQKYGISDVGLAKVCRKLAIPLPGRGYWAKKDAGQAVEKMPLPSFKEPYRLMMPKPKPEAPRIESFTTSDERAQVAKVEERDPQFILKRRSMSHPVIVQAREVLGRSNRDSHDLLWTDDPCLDLCVSKAALPRALRFAAALITALEEEGFKISVRQGRKEKTTATFCNQQIGFTIVEKIDHIPLASPPKGGVLQRVLTYAGTPHEQKPSGRLGLRIWEPWDALPKSWNDGKTRTLEDMLPRSWPPLCGSRWPGKRQMRSVRRKKLQPSDWPQRGHAKRNSSSRKRAVCERCTEQRRIGSGPNEFAIWSRQPTRARNTRTFQSSQGRSLAIG